jgi:DNA-directed RNA polymerase subunit beta
MNVGQVLETHLGVAAKALGIKIATPVFDGIHEKAIFDYIKDAAEVDGFTWIRTTARRRSSTAAR